MRVAPPPPPKQVAECPVSVQLLSVPLYAPPRRPSRPTESRFSTQWDTTALADPHHPPPPLPDCGFPAIPLVSVKPTKVAPLARTTQRNELSSPSLRSGSR